MAIFTRKYQRKNYYVEQGLLSANGYAVYEYAIVLEPHADLAETIAAEKKYYATTYQCPEALHIKPRITLVRFKQHELMEVHIIRQLTNIATAVNTFKVELKNYGSYPSHTIFIQVVSKVEIMDIVKSLKASQKLMKFDDEHKPHFLTAPHISIAGKLLPWQYEKSWAEYQHKHFHGRFIAEHVLLLKRKENTKMWQPVNTFSFKNMHTQPVQAALFPSK
ncbi:2'-5' RNA ligase family protein [Panacibacter sp. DH6]|uniref:2'-5' RNA ligase family protein n=1 Tax=Panacibacter microcysteis TaxID=2793269 RepID=A0A931E3P6_9BACT|nr:2'-5' RNA ligase family protein [Panacibacter microcysteis]MBG9375557.1 2'-5' RNA ligase family protein [Panacibacter microcysteis]